MAQVAFKLSELDELIKNKDSGVTLVPKCVRKLDLSPIQLRDLQRFIKEYLYATVAKYDSQLDGIVLSYKRIKIAEFFTVRDDGKNILSYTADVYVFKPKIGSILTGIINKKSVDHLGCLVHKVFNIAIPRPDNEDESSWFGTNLKIGQEVQFKVVDVELDEEMPYIKGELLEQSQMAYEDNYTVEDMDIDDVNTVEDNNVNCEEKLEQKISIKESEINSENKYIKNDENCVERFSKTFINYFYHKYKILFLKKIQNVLFQGNDRHKNKKNCFLFFCDFFNLDFIEKFDKYTDIYEQSNEIDFSTIENIVKSKSLENISHKRKKKKSKKKKSKNKKKDLDINYKINRLKFDKERDIRSKKDKHKKHKREYDIDEYKKKVKKKLRKKEKKNI